MLNTSTKKAAAFVACLSILSYVATAIVSAYDAALYLSVVWGDAELRAVTVIITVLFALITMCGIGESSIVSIVLFVAHVSVMTLLIIWSFAYGIQDRFSLFTENMYSEIPPLVTSTGQIISTNSPLTSVFFGYCSALLGITGFESAANYVEEMQSPKVFVVSVKWLWFFVGIYNPLISITSMMVLPMDHIRSHSGDLLAEMAAVVGGSVFKNILCIDAVIILCGAVLTSFVGVCGLTKRLAKDSVLPEILARTNCRGSADVSIICFTILVISLFLSIYNPDDSSAINTFGGVYGIAFLLVLTAFSASSILLKLYRPRLARLVITKWWQVYFCFFSVAIGVIGDIILTPDAFIMFLVYLSGFVVVITIMFARVELYSYAIWMIRKAFLVKAKREEEVSAAHVTAACKKQILYDELGELQRCVKIAAEQELFGDEKSFFFRYTNLVRAATRRSISSSSLQSYVSITDLDENDSEVQQLLSVPHVGNVLKHCITALDKLVDTPFVYLAKKADPDSILHAIEYICSNELTNTIYVVHFCDDRNFLGMYNELCNQGRKMVDMGKIDKENVEKHCDKLFLQMFNKDHLFGIEGGEEATSTSYFESLSSESRRMIKYVSILDSFFS
jgi:amino acid transporter